VKVNNVELNLSVKGEGISFIWAHGLMGSMSLDDSTGFFHSENLSEIAKLVRYDARGHGFSQGTLLPEDYHWSNLARDMLRIADKLGLAQFIAGGQSMGSMTSLYAALAAPERIKALVLATPSTAWETRKAQSALYITSASIIEAKGVEAFAGLLRKRPLLPNWLLKAKPQENEKYLNNISSMNKNILPHILRGSSISDLPSYDKFIAPAIPALILAWPDDKTHPMETAKELNALLPKSELVIANSINDVAKWPQIIYKFIEEISSKR
jgi:pimeloyl-ACP methyl ester carboxylesterase